MSTSATIDPSAEVQQPPDSARLKAMPIAGAMDCRIRKLAILTPTGDRHAAFALQQKRLQDQISLLRRSGSGVSIIHHIVVDDGFVPTVPAYPCLLFRRYPQTTDPTHTLSTNLLNVLPILDTYDAVVVEEDDDAYGKHYLLRMVLELEKYDLVGERGAKYYHIVNQTYKTHNDHAHVSFCRTGFTRKVLPHLKLVCETCRQKNSASIDMKLWKTYRGKTSLWFDKLQTSGLSVAMKGMPGRPNLQRKKVQWLNDSGCRQLKQWCQDDEMMQQYLDVPKSADRRPVVYTAIFNNYDKLQVPRVIDPSVRYVCFTDDPSSVPEPYEAIQASAGADPTRANRMYKLLGHRAFWDAPWSIYLDGIYSPIVSPREIAERCLARSHFAITGSVRANWTEQSELQAVVDRGLADPRLAFSQIESYQHAGYSPRNVQCVRAGFMVRKHTTFVGRVLEAWWREVQQWTHRDQLSFGYIAWKAGLEYYRIPVSERITMVKKFEHLAQRKDWRDD